jgi:hypothetical protein
MTAIKAKRPLRSLLQAKNNFVFSIQVGIDELMTRAGYSRQRATDTLLRELGRGGEIPTDQEVRVSFRPSQICALFVSFPPEISDCCHF